MVALNILLAFILIETFQFNIVLLLLSSSVEWKRAAVVALWRWKMLVGQVKIGRVPCGSTPGPSTIDTLHSLRVGSALNMDGGEQTCPVWSP